MKGGAHVSPFATLSVFDSKKYPLTARLTEFSSRRMAKLRPGRVAQSVACMTQEPDSIHGLVIDFCFSFADSRRAVDNSEHKSM